MSDSAVLIAVTGATITAIAVSWFIWWATRRNAFWAMGAGVLVALVIFAAAVLIGWLVARASYGR
jgi:hypothetical protein